MTLVSILLGIYLIAGVFFALVHFGGVLAAWKDDKERSRVADVVRCLILPFFWLPLSIVYSSYVHARTGVSLFSSSPEQWRAAIKQIEDEERGDVG